MNACPILLLATSLALAPGAQAQDSKVDTKRQDDLLTGSGGRRKATGQDQQSEPYLQRDETGAGRPRLTGEGLFGTVSEGETSIRLGGYFDFEYRDEEGQNRRFRFHRLVPLIEARVSDRVSFQTEIEIEDGNEVDVEFAHLDFLLTDEISLRGGVILLPQGKLNLVHDSPIQELTDRPLVTTLVIPTTLRDGGFGLHGSASLGDGEKTPTFDAIDYELYLHSGYRGQDGAGNYLIDRSNGLRNARPHRKLTSLSSYEDNNNSIAVTGRVSTRRPGFELGLSGYHGKWDDQGELDLTMGMVDLEFSPGTLRSLEDTLFANWRFLFEGALGDIETDSAAQAAGVPDGVGGWYAQWGWRLDPPSFLTSGDRPLFEDAGGITLLARFGRVDLDGARYERTVVGFNLRPNADRTVLKFEYQWNTQGGLATGPDHTAFVASIATYF